MDAPVEPAGPREQGTLDPNYDLLLVDRAPLPPHERTWRHPSELGPTRLDIDTGGHGKIAILASGTVAVMMVAALVVAVTPRSTNPLAVSATTAPSSGRTIQAAAGAGEAEPGGEIDVAFAVSAVRSTRIASFTAIPNAIVAVPAEMTSVGRSREAAPATLPDLADKVLVLTDEFAYEVPWSDVALMSFARADVLAHDGSIVARFVDGHLVVTADSKVGSPIALTRSTASFDD